jgi:predicted nucleic acid-binding protein
LSGFVIDASAAIKWVVAEPQSELALPLLDRPLAAPDLLCPEFANILWKKVRRGELTSAEMETAAQALRSADIVLHPTPRLRLLLPRARATADDALRDGG